MTQRVSSGDTYFFFAGAAGFFAAFAISIFRLIRPFSLAWLRLRFIFGVWRLSPRPMGFSLLAGILRGRRQFVNPADVN